MNKSQIKELLKAAGITGAGGIGGALAHKIIGGIGIAIKGTAVGVTLGPFIAIGAGIGLTGYGIYQLGKQLNKNKQEGR